MKNLITLALVFVSSFAVAQQMLNDYGQNGLLEVNGFEAATVHMGVVIKWADADTKSIYTLQKLNDYGEFEDVSEGFPAFNGGFEYLDNQANLGYNYYRLAIKSDNDIINTSKIITIEYTPEDPAEIQIYPNPTQQYATVEVYVKKDETCTIMVIAANGTTVMQREVTSDETEIRKEEFDLIDLPSGSYYITIQQGDRFINKKIVKQ